MTLKDFFGTNNPPAGTYKFIFENVYTFDTAESAEYKYDGQGTGSSVIPAPSTGSGAPVVTGSTRDKIDASQAAWKTVGNAEYVNVRKGAGVKYAVVGHLKKGDRVAVFETKGNWSRISTGYDYAWVYSKYLY
jgi:uncharacterized protein YgiM (DUF1202 family)